MKNTIELMGMLIGHVILNCISIFRNKEYIIPSYLLVEEEYLEKRLVDARQTIEHFINQLCMFNEVCLDLLLSYLTRFCFISEVTRDS